MSAPDDLPPGLPKADVDEWETLVVEPSAARLVVGDLPTADDVEMRDFSQEVWELATRADKFWHSTDPAGFKKNWKINMLFFDGKEIKIIVFKPGTRTEINVPVSPHDTSSVREKLSQLQRTGWTETIKWTWTDPKGDVDGNTCLFNRTLDIGNGKYLYWRWEHTNIGKMVKVSDMLTVESAVEINPGQE